MNDRGLVEVPENAIRDEPIAFGLTAVQLGICGAAVLVAAILNLLPVWEVLRVLLVLAFAGPIFVAAALPVRGEPAYRWLVRAVRYRRGRRVWAASLTVADKPQLSGERDNDVPPAEVQELRPRRAWQGGENTDTAASPASSGQPVEPGAAPVEPMSMRQEPVRLAVVRPDTDDADASSAAGQGEAAERPPVVPHVLPGMRVACFLSFVGGTGRTTLAVEAASLIAARARPDDGRRGAARRRAACRRKPARQRGRPAPRPLARCAVIGLAATVLARALRRRRPRGPEGVRPERAHASAAPSAVGIGAPSDDRPAA